MATDMMYYLLLYSYLTAGIYQDGRLLLMTDEAGNTPPTFDMVFRLTYGNKLAVIGEWEYAHLAGGIYGRMSAGLQYSIRNDFAELSASGQIGQISRLMSNNDGHFFTYVLNADMHLPATNISKRFSDRLYFGLLNSWTKRNDLHDGRVVWSVMGGIRFNLN
jgi:hypothetical protein